MKKGIAVFLLLLALVSAVTGACAEEVSDAEYIMGVAVYDPDDPEMEMFIEYYRNYTMEGFPVRFYFSDVIDSAEEENTFIETAAQEGAQGIISFYGQDIQGAVSLCEELEIYYVLGSGTVSDEDFEAVEENPWFLGSVGPEPDEEYEAGADMAACFAAQDRQSYLIMTGGSAQGNYMHLSRVRGMLETLEDTVGLQMEGDSGEIAASEDVVTLSGDEGVTVTLVPGYLTQGGAENLEQAFGNGQYDAVLSAFYAYPFMDQITEKETQQGSDIAVGAVDSFTERNAELIREDDAFGNAKIDFIKGKYASMAGPAFAMMFNAVTGYRDVNSEDGKAVRLYQGFWQAAGRDEYLELYGYTTGIYENAYSNQDLMSVIRVYNEAASQQLLRELTQAYTVEDVIARIMGS